MGFEFRLLVEPEPNDFGTLLEQALLQANCRRIATSALDEVGIGVATQANGRASKWPQVADLRLETPGSVFVVCHNDSGRAFLNCLIESLRHAGHVVNVADDI